MSAPRSVWVLVWPDGHTGVTFQTYDEAETLHARIGDPAVVVIRYDLAGVAPDVSVASALPLPSAAPEPVVASASPQGPVAVPAGDGGGHDTDHLTATKRQVLARVKASNGITIRTAEGRSAPAASQDAAAELLRRKATQP